MRTQRITSAFNPSSILPLFSASLLFVATTAVGTPSARIDNHDARIAVTAVAGDVAVTMAGEPTRVQTDSTLALPARIVTGSDGSLGFTQAGTNVMIANDSDVELPAEAVDGNLIARLVQHRGNVFYDVAKRDVGKLRVETPLLVAVIKGTQFNVTVGPDSTAISLFEGQLEIRTPDGNDVVQLEAGEIAIRSLVDDAIRVVGMDDLRVEAPAAAAQLAADNTVTSPTVRDLGLADDQGLRTASATSAAGTNVVPKAALDELDLRASRATGLADGDGRVAIDVRPELSAGGATVTTGLDLGLAAATVDAGLDLDAGNATVTVDSRVDLGAASVDTTADVGLDLSGASTDVTLDAGVDLGAADVTVGAGAEAALDHGGGASLGIDASADVVGVYAGLDLALATDSGGVDLGVAVELGPLALDLDAGLDLGDVLDLGLEPEEESTDTTDSDPPPPPPLLPLPRGGLL